MKRQRRTIVLLAAAILIVCVCTGSALAQGNLGKAAEENGFDWLFGTWTGTTDQGIDARLAYKLALDGDIAMASIEIGGQFALCGIISYESFEESATQVSVDNTGKKTEGIWRLMGDSLVWENEFDDGMGNEQKLAIVYSKVDAQTMKVEIHGMDEFDQLSYEPRISVEFDRVSKEQ